MNDRSLSVLDQYDLTLKESFSARGAYICITDKGRKLLYPFNGSGERARLLHYLQLRRKNEGAAFCDLPMETINNEFFSIDSEENKYILKDWIETRECDTSSLSDIEKAMGELALFHKSFRITSDETTDNIISAGELEKSGSLRFAKSVDKHNRELRKVNNFIRSKKRKNSFEFMLMSCFNNFYEQGEEIASVLLAERFERLSAASENYFCFTHGDFSHHEVLMYNNRAVIVHPEHFRCDIQIGDLAHFMRKILEKNEWNLEFGRKMLEAYNNVASIGDTELEYLRLKLGYPEKFWKLANHYFNSGKSWISSTYEIKLNRLIEQEKKKKLFLESI